VASKADDAKRVLALCDLAYEKAPGNGRTFMVLTGVSVLKDDANG
jgi:hypothetical protein